MLKRTARTAIWGTLAAVCAGTLVSCESFRATDVVAPVPSDVKTLKRSTLPPDAVVFDALLVHVPYSDRELVEAFWDDVDEQELDPELRRALNEQGFRAGLIGASTPESLSRLLTLKGRGLRETIEDVVDFSKKEAADKPLIYSKPITLRAGMKSVVEAREDVIPSIPILESDGGALVGKSYNDARALFSVSIEPEPDGSVRFDVTPFLRYGAPKLASRYKHGQLVRTQEQPTKTFENLRCSLPLRPGQFLAIGPSDAKTNALGRCFFTDGSDDYDQKILILRLLVTQRDGQFDRFEGFAEIAREANDDADDSTSEFLDSDFNGLDDERDGGLSGGLSGEPTPKFDVGGFEPTGPRPFDELATPKPDEPIPGTPNFADYRTDAATSSDAAIPTDEGATPENNAESREPESEKKADYAGAPNDSRFY